MCQCQVHTSTCYTLKYVPKFEGNRPLPMYGHGRRSSYSTPGSLLLFHRQSNVLLRRARARCVWRLDRLHPSRYSSMGRPAARVSDRWCGGLGFWGKAACTCSMRMHTADRSAAPDERVGLCTYPEHAAYTWTGHVYVRLCRMCVLSEACSMHIAYVHAHSHAGGHEWLSRAELACRL